MLQASSVRVHHCCLHWLRCASCVVGCLPDPAECPMSLLPVLVSYSVPGSSQNTVHRLVHWVLAATETHPMKHCCYSETGREQTDLSAAADWNSPDLNHQRFQSYYPHSPACQRSMMLCLSRPRPRPHLHRHPGLEITNLTSSLLAWQLQRESLLALERFLPRESSQISWWELLVLARQKLQITPCPWRASARCCQRCWTCLWAERNTAM